LVTCNQPFKEWDHIFLDKQMAIAAIDRLIHHAMILEIDAESYRRKQAISRIKKKTKDSEI
jgi:DNA replication protein DnaC